MQRQQRPQQQIIALPNPDQMGTLILRGSVAFIRRNPVVSGTYFLGILLLIIFGGGGRPLTPEQHYEYHRILQTVDLQAEYRATDDYWRAYHAYQASRGWLWGCDAVCTRNYQRMKEAERIMHLIQQEGAARTADAKNAAGLLSEIGIGEVQDSFWGYFHAGKRFAKRQTMWDMMFMGIRSMSRGRDESWMEFAVKVLLQVLLNLSMGLVMALIFFVMGLWTIVRSYQPNPLVAVLFFCGGAIAAFSFVVTYLLAVYGAAAGGVYTILKVAENASQARIADQQRQRVQYGRPHYD
ncbi:hypothetical protein FisN_21Lh028 [Fistulifera solaris]|uniref:Uncharacterized protein n=1 Tax=Fistulifera solaris TaxID=1519565 RepID=A0A1Z5KJS4_FISSO|nr:hypothetical protein FisN_21Lh028 [Fistulifera solaris]|eukprot:GAX26560.1 hypothetical protein FisN_21Lh028 [Fistulifera solaris]